MRKFSNMVFPENLSEELIKEVYTQFGLAYYHSECLHKELCHIYAFASFDKSKDITRPRLEEKLAYSYSLTLGQVKKEIEGVIPKKLLFELDKGVNKRNFLAHHFWFERAHLFYSVAGMKKMIQELNEYSSTFNKLDESFSKYLIPKIKELGFTDEMFQTHLENIISGKPFDQLPERRKFKKQERIVKAYEFIDTKGRKPLIFETEDGLLWQLCDIGLGWTYYNDTKPDWQENEIISKYLPANINPRPKNSRSWNYEFKLAKGAILWVRRGNRERSFKWGIRK